MGSADVPSATAKWQRWVVVQLGKFGRRDARLPGCGSTELTIMRGG
jgi:hypothetical protein